MSVDRYGCSFTIPDDAGIGAGLYAPTMWLYVGEGGVSIAEPEKIVVSGNTPGCRFEVRREGKVGMK